MTDGFLNRVDELDMLERRWASGAAQFFVLFGRRRVGKSELIAAFCEGKRTLYYEATASKAADHLEDVSAELRALTHDPVLAEQSLDSWAAVLAAVGSEAEAHGPLVFVIDEFQFVARETPDIGSRLSTFWRQTGRRLPLFLILSGSDVSFFEQDVMGYSGQTYGRRTGSHRLLPFTPLQERLFLPDWPAADLVRAHSVWGGMPYYLAAVDPAAGVLENIYETILAPGALLREEPTFLFAQEGRLRDPRPYLSTLRAIAAGRTQQRQIAERVADGDSSKAAAYLRTLQEMGLVGRIVPVTAANPDRTRQTRYRILDPFLRFWFAFVHPHLGRLRTAATARRHLEQHIAPRLDAFVSAPGYEEVCRAWLADQTAAAAVGSWWGNLRTATDEGPRSVQYEADAVAVDGDGRVLALGSCKWTAAPHPDRERTKLETIAAALTTSGQARPELYFFAREGFGEALEAKAIEDPDRIHLVALADLYPP